MAFQYSYTHDIPIHFSGILTCDFAITLEVGSMLHIDIYDAGSYDHMHGWKVYLNSPQLTLEWHSYLPLVNETYTFMKCTYRCYGTFLTVNNLPLNAIISYQLNSVELIIN